MYRAGSVYDEIDKVIYDIYQDYDIKTFPVDEVEVCNKLGVALVPYSAYPREGSIVTGSELLPIAHFYNHLGIRMPSKQVKGFRILIQIMYGDQRRPKYYDK